MNKLFATIVALIFMAEEKGSMVAPDVIDWIERRLGDETFELSDF